MNTPHVCLDGKPCEGGKLASGHCTRCAPGSRAADPLTANTITDEDIRGLREEAFNIYASACRALGVTCDGFKVGDPENIREHRARCAAIINARKHCPSCGTGPLHATESDDLGRCAACAVKAGA